MPAFVYKAKEGPSKTVNGVVDAASIGQAVQKVIALGLTPLDVVPAGPARASIPAAAVKPRVAVRSARVPAPEITVFTRQLSDLVDAAVPLLRAIQLVLRQTKHPVLKSILEDVYKDVEDGKSFGNALTRQPAAFSPFYVSMVRAGEIGGKLGVLLARLADYLEKELETRQQIRSSLAYPILVLIVGVLTIFVLLSFVVPRMSAMFEDVGQGLPAMTSVILAISEVCGRYWWLIAGGIIGIFVAVRQAMPSLSARRKIDALKLKVPFLGEFIKVAETAHFSRTLAALLENGVVLTTGLQTVAPTIGNQVIQGEIREMAIQVQSGTSLRQALQDCRSLPEVAVNMIAVGEETGHLERALGKIAGIFDRQTAEATKTMIALLGPLVLAAVVITIGFVMIAMLLPIFRMNLLIQ